MLTTRKSLVAISFCGLLLVPGANVSAGAIAPGTIDPELVCGGALPFPDGCKWFVGDPTLPIPIEWDPTAPPLSKTFPMLGSSMPPGGVIPLSEFYSVAGSVEWTDWHEEIVTPGWEWASPAGIFPIDPSTGSRIGTNPISGLVVNPSPPSGTTLAFDFDPLLLGTAIEIEKYLLWTGTGPTTIEPTVLEFPTVPIPAAVWLFGSGLLGLIGIARRRLA